MPVAAQPTEPPATGRVTRSGAKRAAPGDYTARHLSVLEGLEAVRKRPGMYIGSTDSRGLMHCLWEIIDNSVDEALAGHCDRIDVVLMADGSVEVHDDGRGIPVDEEPKTGLSGVEVVFTKLHAGGKFGGGSYTASGGLHGVGASVVNALSARLDVEVDRGGKIHAMSFRRGEPGVFDDPQGRPVAGRALHAVRRPVRAAGRRQGAPGRDRHPGALLGRPGRSSSRTPGSATTSWSQRARQTSYLVPGLTLVLRDERGLPGTPGADGPHEETFCHRGGIVEYVEFLGTGEPVTDVWRLAGSGHFRETVPVLDAQGHMTPTEVERECVVDIAVRWDSGYDTKVRSFVNIIATPKGGTHLAGFEAALVKTFKRQVELNARRLKAGGKDDRLDKEDVLAGLTAIVTVRLAEPQFEGQTKEVLGTNAVRGIVARVVERELTGLLTSTKRGEKQQAAAAAREGRRRDEDAGQRPPAQGDPASQERPGVLVAAGQAGRLPHRRRRAQRAVHRRGRQRARHRQAGPQLGVPGPAADPGQDPQRPEGVVADMLRNAECASIIQVIGAGSGRTFDLDAARYGKVILMTDADVDGAHIRTLLLTLFFRYMRPLVEQNRVFAAVPPLHRLEVVSPKKGQDKYVYTYSEAELRGRPGRPDQRKGQRWKEPLQRYKGLGEMDADQLAETTMDPRHRTLRRVTLADAERAERVFDLLMGSDVAPRKDFLVAGAGGLDRDRIDA